MENNLYKRKDKLILKSGNRILRGNIDGWAGINIKCNYCIFAVSKGLLEATAILLSSYLLPP